MTTRSHDKKYIDISWTKRVWT